MVQAVIQPTSGKLSKKELAEIATDYGLPKLNGVKDLYEGTDRAEYLLETTKGKFLATLDLDTSEIELKRELDLLLFLKKHNYPCLAPLADRRGRHYRDIDGAFLLVYKPIDGRVLAPENITLAQLEAVGRVVADLHILGKAYKKGVDTRFAFDRVADIYLEARERLPTYYRRIVRTLDEELDYLKHYLEGKLPKGIIHGDLDPERLKFKGDKVVAVLGFEAASRGKFIFELANAVNFLCFDDNRYALKRFEALIAGYEGLRTLSLAEWDAFPNELRFSAFRVAVTRLRDFFHATGDERDALNKGFQDFYERLRILRREREGGMEPMLMAMATGYDYRKYQRVKAVEKRSR